MYRKGQLLLDVLISIAIGATVLSLSAGVIYVSLRGGEVSVEREIAAALAEETLEAVRAFSFERWKGPIDGSSPRGIYDLNRSDGSTNKYYPSLLEDSAGSSRYIKPYPFGGSLDEVYNIQAISGTSLRDMWVAGYNGNVGVGSPIRVSRWNGESFTDNNPWTDQPNGLAVFASNDVWIVGSNGRVSQWNGSSWNTDEPVWPVQVPDVWGVSKHKNGYLYIAAGSDIYKYDGAIWTRYQNPLNGSTKRDVAGVTTPSNGEAIWFAGGNGVVGRWNGAWVDESNSGGGVGSRFNSAFLRAISLLPEEAWIVGYGGGVWSYKAGNHNEGVGNLVSGGGAWVKYDGTGKWGTTDIEDVAAFDYDDVYIAGANGEVWRFDGVDWSKIPGAGKWGTNRVNALSDRYSGDVWIGSQFSGLSSSVWDLNNAKWDMVAVSGTNNQTTRNGVVYTRSFYLQNICRDSSFVIMSITNLDGTSTACSSGTYDPNTLKVTVDVSWDNNTFFKSEHITRWNNDTCLQTNWDGGASAGVKVCPVTTYESAANVVADTSIRVASIGVNANLISNTFDSTQLGNGPAYNRIKWLGDKGTSGGIVKLYLRVSDCSNFATNPPSCNSGSEVPYNVASCTSPSDAPSNPNTWYKLDCNNNMFNNKKYFRYEILINTLINPGTQPRVDDVIIDLSP